MAAAAVLRVKRKRGAEAAEALLLACKRPRTAGELALGEQVVRTLFRLAATVGSQDDSIQRHIKKAISKDKALLAVNPSSTSSQRVQLSLRASQQAASQEGRYKVIASHRRNALKFQLGDEKNDQETGSEISQPQDEGGGNGQKNSSTSSGSSKDVVGSGKEIQVFDVQHEDNKADSKHIHIKDSGPGQYDPETILCNSVKMIREKLTVSNCGLGTEHRENMEEYVYDIYYTDGYISRGGIEDILSVVPYHKEHELMSDDLIGDETYEDEDDENDENNWRNDYPDEDDWNSEEDMEKQDGPFSSEEEDRLNF